MKLTYEDKLEIYRLYSEEYASINSLSLKYDVDDSSIRYLIKLIETYGPEIARHGNNRKYSREFKEAAVLRALNGQESLKQISLDLGLTSKGLLVNWVRNYKENGYNIVEKKRGRRKNESDDEKIGRQAEGSAEENQTARRTELEIISRIRILKKVKCLNGEERQPTVKEITDIVTALREELKLSLSFILHVLNTSDDLPSLPRSVYYYWKDREDPDMVHDEIMNQIIAVFYYHQGRYGYRRITNELRQKHLVNNKLVKRLMKRMGLFGITPKAKYKSYKGDMNGTVSNHLLDKTVDTENHRTVYTRNFSTTSINQKWTTDVSEFHIAAGKLYLSPIMDMYSKEIISYSISRSPNFKQTLDMLDGALGKYKHLEGLIFQSDQG